MTLGELSLHDPNRDQRGLEGTVVLEAAVWLADLDCGQVGANLGAHGVVMRGRTASRLMLALGNRLVDQIGAFQNGNRHAQPESERGEPDRNTLPDQFALLCHVTSLDAGPRGVNGLLVISIDAADLTRIGRAGCLVPMRRMRLSASTIPGMVPTVPTRAQGSACPNLAPDPNPDPRLDGFRVAPAAG